jgi:foldase protein PrsA
VRRITFILMFVFVAAALATVGCSAPFTLPGQTAAAAVVNGQSISTAAYERQVVLAINYLKNQGVDATTADGKVMIEQMRQEVLSQLVDQELINQVAKKEGFAVTPAEIDTNLAEIVTQMGGQTELDAWMKSSLFTTEELRQTISDQLVVEKVFNKVSESVPTTAEQVHARHILVATKEEADAVLARLAKGEDFAKVAAEVSLDTGSASTGGDLGFFPKGAMVPEFEAGAFALQSGQTSQPVQTDYGFHIINLIERDPARVLDDTMLHANQQEAFGLWVDALRKAAKIEYPGATPGATPTK